MYLAPGNRPIAMDGRLWQSIERQKDCQREAAEQEGAQRDKATTAIVQETRSTGVLQVSYLLTYTSFGSSCHCCKCPDRGSR